VPFTRANQQNILKFSIDSTFVPSQIEVPAFGNDITLVFEKISAINRSTILGDMRSSISHTDLDLPPINVKIEMVGNNNIVPTNQQAFSYQTTQVGSMSITPQTPANYKSYPAYQTIEIPRGENQIRVSTFMIYPRNKAIYKVIGAVETPSQSPVKDQQISFGNDTFGPVTDAQGKFTLYLPPGTYILYAPGCDNDRQSITITDKDVNVWFLKK
jgi:hypothetical protein